MATINLDSSSSLHSEGGGPVDVCAVITGLPTGGLGTNVAVGINVSGISAGMLILRTLWPQITTLIIYS